MAAPPPELAHAIAEAAAAHGVPADVLTGIWRIESGSSYPNPYVNSSGYGGLFGTTKWNAPTLEQANYAASTLANLIRTRGSLAAALHAYSGGGYTSVPGGPTGDPGTTTPVVDTMRQQGPADTTDARRALASFLIGNVGRHQDPGQLVQSLTQARSLVTQPEASTTPSTPETAAQTPQGPSTPAVSSGPAGLVAVPSALATRDGIEIDQRVLAPAARIAQAFGVKINSGYRSPEHNASVGGAPRSDHLAGDAVDFTGSPDQLAELHAWAEGKFPYVEPMSQSKDHVHISFLRGGSA